MQSGSRICIGLLCLRLLLAGSEGSSDCSSDRFPRVSVVIPSFNRFEALQEAVHSVQKNRETYAGSIEIIVVDDASSDSRYHDISFRRTVGFRDVVWIRRATNSKEQLGYPCVALNRNTGIANATGDFIMLLDDDDAFLPTKVHDQIASMRRGKYTFSATEAFIGHGGYRPTQQKYKRFNRGFFWSTLQKKFAGHGMPLGGNFPAEISLGMLKVHNYLITSSVCFTRELFQQHGPFDTRTRMHTDMPEDLDLWLRMFGDEQAGVGAASSEDAHTHSEVGTEVPQAVQANGVYLVEPLVYYDLDHGLRPSSTKAQAEPAGEFE
jgi:GT2 family glycosyltransferase